MQRIREVSQYRKAGGEEMNKPEWMLCNSDDGHLYELLTLEDVFADQKIIANYAQRKLLEYLRDHEWYTKVVPQGKGQRIISKKVGISREFVELMLKQLEEK
jgi:hypothetical protein